MSKREDEREETEQDKATTQEDELQFAQDTDTSYMPPYVELQEDWAAQQH